MSARFFRKPGTKCKQAPAYFTSDSEAEEDDRLWLGYISLELGRGLGTPSTYEHAVSELDFVVQKIFIRASKDLRRAIMSHCMQAIVTCDWTQRHQNALTGLASSCKRLFPKAKRDEFLRSYKQKQVLITRQLKKDIAEERRTDTEVIHSLNEDILQKIFGNLGPEDLVSAMLVSKEWADAASSDFLWKKFMSGLSNPTGSFEGSKREAQAVLPSKWRKPEIVRFAGSSDRVKQWKCVRLKQSNGRIRWKTQVELNEGLSSESHCIPLNAKEVIVLTFGRTPEFPSEVSSGEEDNSSETFHKWYQLPKSS